MDMDDRDRSSDFLEEHEQYYHGDTDCNLGTLGDDLFSILESLDDHGFGGGRGGGVVDVPQPSATAPLDYEQLLAVFSASPKDFSSSADQTELDETNSAPKIKRLKLSSAATPSTTATTTTMNPSDQDGGRMSHTTVERNRRKQMNDHLTVLRSLMPCFYVKRGDQASIIGGVVDYINELQQVLQSLEAKKQRKAYSCEVLSSPRLQQVPSPRPPGPSPSVLSPRKPPLSPRLGGSSLPPISPRTPQPTSPYKPTAARTILQQPQILPAAPNIFSNYLISSPTMVASSSLEPSPTSSSATTTINNSIDNLNELFANSKSALADVEVKFSGPNVLLKTVSPRIPGQALKIISTLEDLSLEILRVSITTADETMFNSFTIKIGIECQLSAEELVHQIQQTFC
ncbi:transcription factor SPEECHLESS-like [Pyrus ussuriensis x Pyrus communis]|uniref:Transcription factor SPEECHLESS-like n=1 Tax=Pyrus ussuriensis x Pyrus communis TaxID=2448454 RepID=A0A5N5F6V8_9ROSA|nr:transcription factor SPEECHLESS-like [Pyrus ussuriensis x Pyrus communis]